ncbi:hypothetical protein [Arsenophonus apicola]|uniref:Uncharacterized protein n=1 Tax=Arsenophonus apicola TaxID=2879119 RepID=A0ABY8P089_9GAMM|nr:hypothetical protein [Arsenophonus apicola]WGO82235.1 hypothetical protein QG404_00870 [Arsenophonus apicola]
MTPFEPLSGLHWVAAFSAVTTPTLLLPEIETSFNSVLLLSFVAICSGQVNLAWTSLIIMIIININDK